MDRIRIAVVSGGIGAGKSTILDEVASQLPSNGTRVVHIIKEPVSSWSYLLSKVYTSPKNYLFRFQTMVFLHFIGSMLKIEAEVEDDHSEERLHLVFLERSMLDSYHVFVQANVPQWKHQDVVAFKQLIDSMHESSPYWAVARYYYVRVSPERCKERMDRRARKGEEGVPLEYLRTVETCYERNLIPLLTGRLEEYDNENDEDCGPSHIAGEIIRHFLGTV